jgi:Tol biopolymer transport system component
VLDNKPPRDPKDGFYLNQCWVSISDNHLYFEQCAIKLEPKVIQVLECLAEHLDTVVNKEFLLKKVWKNQVVADDSLVRCISVLRKHFKNNQVLGLRIDTVAKKGYRLCLVNEQQDSQLRANQQVVASESISSFSIRKVVVLLVVLAVSFSILYRGNWLNSNNPANLDNQSEYQRSVLLASSSKERYPELSADGTWLTYSKSTDKGMAIFVKSLTGLGLQQITSGKFYDHQPTFSANARQIIFARINQLGQCEIRLISIIGGADKKLADCRHQGVYAMEWTKDNSAVYFIDKSSSIANGQLNKLTPATGQLELIEILPSNMLEESGQDEVRDQAFGVDDIAISHDARHIAVTLSPMLGVEDIYISSLSDSFLWKRLSFEQTKIHGLAFSADDQAILFSSNRTGTFSLWRTNVSQWQPKLISQGIPNISEISTSADGKIALERWTEATSVQAIDRQGNSNEIVAEKNVNWAAVQSPINQDIVFLSNRSGYSELWLKSEGNLRQLTNFRGPWLMSPSWSIDGQMVAFSSNQPEGNRLHWFDFATQTVTEIEQTDNSEAPIWHPKELQLYYTKSDELERQVWRWDYSNKTHVKVADIAAKAIKFSREGVMFFTKANQKGLWKINKNNQQELIVSDLEPVDWNNWLVGEQKIYYINRRPGTGATLLQLAIDSATESKTDSVVNAPRLLKNLLYFSGLSMDSRGEQLWYARIESEDADIDILSPAPIE